MRSTNSGTLYLIYAGSMMANTRLFELGWT
jgi:hypothetical protein